MIKEQKKQQVEEQTRLTSNGDVRDPTGPTDVDGVGKQAKDGLGNQREVSGVLHQLQRGRAEAQPMDHVEVEGQPRKAPKTLHPEPKPTQHPHPAQLSIPHPAAAAASPPLLAVTAEELRDGILGWAQEWIWDVGLGDKEPIPLFLGVRAAAAAG